MENSLKKLLDKNKKSVRTLAFQVENAKKVLESYDKNRTRIIQRLASQLFEVLPKDDVREIFKTKNWKFSSDRDERKSIFDPIVSNANVLEVLLDLSLDLERPNKKGRFLYGSEILVSKEVLRKFLSSVKLKKEQIQEIVSSVRKSWPSMAFDITPGSDNTGKYFSFHFLSD